MIVSHNREKVNGIFLIFSSTWVGAPCRAHKSPAEAPQAALGKPCLVDPVLLPLRRLAQGLDRLRAHTGSGLFL